MTGNVSLPADFELEISDQCLPESIRGNRTIDRDGDSIQQWLIKWHNHPIEEATWEDTLVIQRQFPDAGLEDKTIF